jgi:hypothetical protein
LKKNLSWIKNKRKVNPIFDQQYMVLFDYMDERKEINDEIKKRERKSLVSKETRSEAAWKGKIIQRISK